MTGRLPFLLVSAILLAAPTTLRGQDVVVPAGMTLQCTITERNLSSKTDAIGDPVLCDAGPLYMFGVPLLPRGAYLEGHFSDYRKPGHFWGKGWMQLDFDKMLLPGAEIPLTSKVTSVPHLPVDSEGKIHGTGHAGRDAVEWAIPVLWPIKIVTLPMRGPRPTLKGRETTITLKLMQDVLIPQQAVGFPTDRRVLKPGAFRPSPGSSAPSFQDAVSRTPSNLSFAPEPPANQEGTALILRDGGGMLVKTYWFEDGERIRYHAFDGSDGVLPIRALDLGATVRVNREHGVGFMISSEDGGGGSVGN